MLMLRVLGLIAKHIEPVKGGEEPAEFGLNATS